MYNKNKTKIVGIRFRPNHAILLSEVCDSRGEDMSSFIRRATLSELGKLSYLGVNEKKALGLGDLNAQAK